MLGRVYFVKCVCAVMASMSAGTILITCEIGVIAQEIKMSQPGQVLKCQLDTVRYLAENKRPPHTTNNCYIAACLSLWTSFINLGPLSRVYWNPCQITTGRHYFQRLVWCVLFMSCWPNLFLHILTHEVSYVSIVWDKEYNFKNLNMRMKAFFPLWK